LQDDSAGIDTVFQHYKFSSNLMSNLAKSTLTSLGTIRVTYFKGQENIYILYLFIFHQ
jgi:hypothetical protein